MKNKITDNQDFIRFIQAASVDQDLKQRILNLLALDKFNRKSVMNTMINEMRLSNESSDFIEILFFLTDDSIAKQTVRILQDDEL